MEVQWASSKVVARGRNTVPPSFAVAGADTHQVPGSSSAAFLTGTLGVWVQRDVSSWCRRHPATDGP